MKKKNILIVFGTRPEGIKLAPLILELRKYPKLYNVIVCNTEQQKQLSSQALSYFGLTADIHLNAMSPDQSLGELQNRLMTRLQQVIDTHSIDVIMVQGDTMSVYCGALSGFYNKLPVLHVEAGLRSHNIHEPFPEEAIRRMTASITAMHFAPTSQDRDTLIREGVSGDNVFVTGNTGIDALFRLPKGHILRAAQELEKQGIPEDILPVLMTVHRRENAGERLEDILTAFERLLLRFPEQHFILPVHPNPNFKNPIEKRLSACSNLHLTKPLDYPQIVHLMQRSVLILTDSGGLQEEAPALGVPVLVLRHTTERMATIDSGCGELVGTDPDKITESASRILENPAVSAPPGFSPYGDGKASVRIEKLMRARFFEKKQKGFSIAEYP